MYLAPAWVLCPESVTSNQGQTMIRRGVYAVAAAVGISAAIAAAGVMAATAHAKPGPAAALTWRSYRVPGAGKFAAVQCPSTQICVAITKHDELWTTRNASAQHPAWKQTVGLQVMGPEEDFEQQSGFNLSCPTVHLCVTSYFGDDPHLDRSDRPEVGVDVDEHPTGGRQGRRQDRLALVLVGDAVRGRDERVGRRGGRRHVSEHRDDD